MLILIIILIFMALRLGNWNHPDYDERQILAQGKAAHWTLYTLFAYFFIVLAGCTQTESGFFYRPEITTEAYVLFGIFLGLMVYFTSVTCMDAFTPVNFKGYPWFLLAAGGFGFTVSFYNAMNNETAAGIGYWADVLISILPIWMGLLTLILQALRSRRED